MKIVDVRQESNDDVGFVFDASGDYICKLDECIHIYSGDFETEVPLCGYTKESIIDFIKAVKMSAGITENLGL